MVDYNGFALVVMLISSSIACVLAFYAGRQDQHRQRGC